MERTKIIFESNRKFRIWVYTVSHNSLLLRSEMKYKDQDNYSENTSYNIDMEFLAVDYINLNMSFDGLKLVEVLDLKILPSNLLEKIEKNKDVKVYRLVSKSIEYYIVSSSLLIGKNKWENSNRIFNFSLELVHDEILYSSEAPSIDIG